MWFTRTAIQHPVFATMVMVALSVLGLFSYPRLGVEALPDVTPPVVEIQVAYPGASPEQVEVDVARPVESAVNSVAGLKMVRSISLEGVCWTIAEFGLDADLDRSLQEVRDRIAQLRGQFPREVRDPVIGRTDTENSSPVANFALVGRGVGARELTLAAEQLVARRMERVAGVGRVTIAGGVTREVQVRLRPERLTAYGLGVDPVLRALREAHAAVPVGLVSSTAQEAIVRVDGRMRAARDFGDIVVARAGAPSGADARPGPAVTLSQVAEVLDGTREPQGYARFNGAPAIAIAVYKSQDANIVETGKRIAAAGRDLAKVLPPGVELHLLWSKADWVEASLDNVRRTIVEGGLLTVLIVFLFLGSWRSTVITGLTLPIAVVATFGAMFAFGFTLNYMTMMALSLSIGLLIDDAIVVRENIVRHQARGLDPVTAARQGTEEIGLAVLATTLSIIAVFVPIAFMSGLIGRFFYPFGLTVAVAVAVSMFVSFTLDPMLSAVWHDPPRGARDLPGVGPVLRAFDRGIDRAHALYDRVLAWALAHRRATLALATVAFLGSLPVAAIVGTEMVPEADEGVFNLRITTPVGSSLEVTDERIRRVEAALREIPEIRDLDVQSGADLDGSGGRNGGRIGVILVDREQRQRSRKEVERAVRERVARIPGVELKVGWGGGPIYVALLGNDDAAMARVMQEFRARVERIPGVRDVDISLREGVPAYRVRLRPEVASEFGLSHAQLGSTLRTLVAGESAGRWLAPDGQNYEVVVQLPRDRRTGAADLAGLDIATGRWRADGTAEHVALRELATIERAFNPENIRRQDLQRRLALFAQVDGRAVGDVGREVRALVANWPLPPGLRFDIGGEARDVDEVGGAMLAALGLAVIFIYIVLASQFGSFLQPLAIMASLPLSIVGVMIALLVTGTTLNIFSMIGVVFLMGLVTKNAILLVDCANRGEARGLDRLRALREAGQVRLRPILMTSAAMVFGMLPLAAGLGEGAEQQAPMGRAIIGGVITSTLLTLVVVPVIDSYLSAFVAWVRRRPRRAGGSGQGLDARPAAPER